MIEILGQLAYAVDEPTDRRILQSLERCVAFDADELVTIIEDMYAQPDKKADLLAILEETLLREAQLARTHPEEHRRRRAAGETAWRQARARFESRLASLR